MLLSIAHSPAVTAAADIYRSDLHTAGYGTGKYGFMYPMNWSSYTPGYYKITAKAVSMNGTGSEFDLYTNPKYYENNPGRGTFRTYDRIV